MSDSQILVTGKSGQLGSALLDLLGDQAIGFERSEFDLANPGAMFTKLQQLQPKVIFNAAAYTQVDKAEEEIDMAMRINVEAPGILAAWCAENQVPLVHFSTDYVFSGQGALPWKESDPAIPQNIYGQSKRKGEELILASGCKALIFRTSWVYDENGKNFLNTMLRLGAERTELSVVSDQFGAPTYAHDLAKAAITVLKGATAFKTFPTGIYHMCNAGFTSWHGFAEFIFAIGKQMGMEFKVEKVHGIPSRDYPRPATRPLNSRLNTQLLHDTFGYDLSPWQDGLLRCMEKRNENH